MKQEKKMLKILLSLFLTLSVSANTYFCSEELGTMPILQQGRVKPLLVHSKSFIKFLTGKSKVGEYGPVTSYCLLTLKAFGLKTDLDIQARIDHSQTRELLDSAHTMSFDKLVTYKRDIRVAMMKAGMDTSYGKSLQKLMQKISYYEDIASGNNWKLAAEENGSLIWLSITQLITEERIKELSKQTKTPFLAAFEQSTKTYDKYGKTVYKFEYKYAKMYLPHVAMVVSLLGLAALVLFKRFSVALGLAVITVIIQTLYLIFRVYISGRAPVTNMYETVLFSGYGALVMAMIIGHFKKEKAYIYMGLAYNVLSLMMMNFAGNMVSAEIGPLVPVLRDNFWLSTHVSTIMISYGALALSWILANTILFKRKFGKLSDADEAYYNDHMYTTLKYGTVLLAAGIILGGVWADYSWGRFWGWDPKETWSLIVLCIYMAILHGKYTAWIPNRRLAHLIAGAFLSVMMAWFGVNYILATGLHSYGFSEGGAIFLGSFFAVQIIILIITLDKKSKGPA
jgi:cytochrome c-type biogenesis protein CcsB